MSEVKETVEKKREPEEEVVEERFYVIPLRKAWIVSRLKRTPKAMRVLKEFLKRHLKTEDFRINGSLNRFIWSRGIEKPPRKVRVRVVKDKEGIFTVYPLEEKKFR
ncbi:50S ribosomal protein L31e [Candidatus Bathyarchaeota archaeon]|nr:MAG: 50S ribosomal protein L31e [Candidatus Bathyarchaeota archaeon]